MTTQGLSSGAYSALAGDSFGDVVFNTFAGAMGGLAGGTVGSMIGGVPDVFVGSMANYTTNWTINTARSVLTYQDVEPFSVSQMLMSATLSTGMYFAMAGIEYEKVHHQIANKYVTFGGYLKINADYQKARFWHKEFAGYILDDGSVVREKWKNCQSSKCYFYNYPDNAVANYHIHWDKPREIYKLENPDGTLSKVTREEYYNAPSEQYGEHTTVYRYHSPTDINNNKYLVINRYDSAYKPSGSSYYYPVYRWEDPYIRFFLFY